MLHRNGSILLLEALPSTATDMVNTLQEVYQWVTDIDHPGLSGMFDFHNTGDETEAWDTLIRKFFPIIRHVHFNSREGSWPLPDQEGQDPAYRSAFSHAQTEPLHWMDLVGNLHRSRKGEDCPATYPGILTQGMGGMNVR
jgi:hypothetical protein